MAYIAALMRRLASLAPARQTETFTPQDVRRLLGPRFIGSEERRAAVLKVAAVPSLWLAHLDLGQAQNLGDYADKLPSIVYFYANGTPLEHIVARLGGWSTWRAERALDAACACIAAELNGRRPIRASATP